VDIDPQKFLPLREPTFFILLSLAQQMSEGKIVLSNGTLYGALTRLQDQGLIERVSRPEPADSGRPRKAYRLTEAGLKVLDAETKRMANLVRASRRNLPGVAE
jgi:PadR family transcriptional regulator PadR